MSNPRPELVAAAANVDVIETAGWVIGNPNRNAINATAAQVLALAHAVEKFWAVCLEAEILARAVALPADEKGQAALRDHVIDTQARTVNDLMNALRGTPESDGEAHGT
ncbi:MAG: hypothetical protein CMJ42_22795 [Phyllobacteriaceae bacterium]|nr:hypothetical protein [Phyllobacteriaceae bacterium]